jgi:hypothetical protein
MPLALSEVIAQLRAELAEAMRAGENEQLRFELGPVEVELTVGVEKEAKPGAKAKFWVSSARRRGSRPRPRSGSS